MNASRPEHDAIRHALPGAGDPSVLVRAASLASTAEAAAGELAAALVHAGLCDQAWVGLCRDRVVTLSGSAPLGHDALSRESEAAVVAAMQEALEQGVSLAVAEFQESDAVLLEHALLHRHWGRPVATVPLGVAGDAVLAVTLSRDGAAYSFNELQRAECLLAAAAPLFRWIARAGEPWHARLARTLMERVALARQPAWRWRRRAVAAATCLVAAAALWPIDATVDGTARIEGEQQRVLPAPTDGFVKTAHARPGDHVRAGQPLLDLVDADLRLERDRWSSQLMQHENAYAAAMARSDRVAAATAMARVGEAQAQLALLDQQLDRGRLVAPFDALVVQGDWSQAIGAPVKQGDALVTLASMGRHRVVVDVDETDVARVRAGQHGWVSLSGWPWDREAIIVERVAPLARTAGGRNVFEVQARLAVPRDDVRPGLLGRAAVVTGRGPWLWAALRDAWLRIRLTAWSWWG